MSTVYNVIFWLLTVFNGFLSISILISWVPSLTNYKIFRAIIKVSDWYLKPFRGVLVIGPIDFTPLIGIGIYGFILSCFSYII